MPRFKRSDGIFFDSDVDSASYERMSKDGSFELMTETIEEAGVVADITATDESNAGTSGEQTSEQTSEGASDVAPDKETSQEVASVETSEKATKKVAAKKTTTKRRS